MSFFSKLSSVITKISTFLSKNTSNLTEAAVIAETITGNVELIPLTTTVGTAVQAGSTSLANEISIKSLTDAAVIAETATGNDELISTTNSVAAVVSKITNK